jgi:hypothetical protein
MASRDGIFSGYDAAKRTYSDKSGWGYEMGDDGFAKVDPTLQDPRCVYQLMKQHYSRYNIELASQICGMPVDAMQKNLGRDRHLLDTRQDHDDPLCVGLDPTFDWRADHPQCGDGAIAVG